MNESLAPDQIFIRKLTDIVLANLGNDKFGVNDLAKASGKSLYRLGRMLHQINGRTVNQFIREVRLQKALEMLLNDDYSASEVAYKVGFGSPAYFNHCFRKHFGYPPGEVKKIHANGLVRDDSAYSGSGNRSIRSAWKSYIYSFPAILVLAIIMGMTGLFIYRKVHKPRWTDGLYSPDGRISIAVMPFRNLTRDTAWNVWQEGIQQTIIYSLSNSKELRVSLKENIDTQLQKRGITDYTTITSGLGSVISRALNTNIYISGSIKKAGTRIRVDAQLVNTKMDEVLQSFEINGPDNDSLILDITDALRKEITDFLLVSRLVTENSWLISASRLQTKSPEALKYSIYADKAFRKADWVTARQWLFRALKADSGYVDAMTGIYYTYSNQGMIEESLYWVRKLYNIRNKMPLNDQLFFSWIYAENFEPPDTCIKYLKQLQAADDQTNYSYLIGAIYVRSGQHDKAITAYKDHLKYCRNKGKFYLKDNWVYPALAEVYQTTGQYKKEKKLFRQAERINDDKTSEFFSWVIRDEVALAVAENDTIKADKLIKRLIPVLKDRSYSEAEIASTLGSQYWRGRDTVKAEEYFRKALRLDPENPSRLNALSNRLIDQKKNFNEAMDLIDRAMEKARNRYDYYNYLDTKAWGLYKFGRLQESLELFQRLWDETPFKMYLFKAHLEEVKKAAGENRQES